MGRNVGWKWGERTTAVQRLKSREERGHVVIILHEILSTACYLTADNRFL